MSTPTAPPAPEVVPHGAWTSARQEREGLQPLHLPWEWAGRPCSSLRLGRCPPRAWALSLAPFSWLCTRPPGRGSPWRRRGRRAPRPSGLLCRPRTTAQAPCPRGGSAPAPGACLPTRLITADIQDAGVPRVAFRPGQMVRAWAGALCPHRRLASLPSAFQGL